MKLGDKYNWQQILFFLSRIGLCSFSGYKIYPGHGKTLVKIDGKVSFYRISSISYQIN